MKDWEVCAPPGFSLGFEGDNGATVLEVSTDLTEEWDLKVDVEKDGEKNIIQLTRTGMVYSALLTASMLADDGTYAMQVRGTLGDYVRHSNLFYATVFRSINAVDFFPPPLPSEFEQMEDRLTSINDNPPMPGENGYWMIWNPDKKEYEESDVPRLPQRTKESFWAFWTALRSGFWAEAAVWRTTDFLPTATRQTSTQWKQSRT